jgi:hypothetical protein
MRTFLRKHAATVVVASVVAMVLGGVPALAHFTSINSHDVNHLDKDYTKTFYRRSAAVTIGPDLTSTAGIACPSGTVAMGGGGYTELPEMVLEASYPTDGGSSSAGYTGWRIYVHNYTTGSGDARAYVICRRVFANPTGNYDEGDAPVRAGLKARTG